MLYSFILYSHYNITLILVIYNMWYTYITSDLTSPNQDEYLAPSPLPLGKYGWKWNVGLNFGYLIILILNLTIFYLFKIKKKILITTLKIHIFTLIFHLFFVYFDPLEYGFKADRGICDYYWIMKKSN